MVVNPLPLNFENRRTLRSLVLCCTKSTSKFKLSKFVRYIDPIVDSHETMFCTIWSLRKPCQRKNQRSLERCKGKVPHVDVNLDWNLLFAKGTHLQYCCASKFFIYYRLVQNIDFLLHVTPSFELCWFH